jgi:hypothetical protein
MNIGPLFIDCFTPFINLTIEVLSWTAIVELFVYLTGSVIFFEGEEAIQARPSTERKENDYSNLDAKPRKQVKASTKKKKGKKKAKRL